MMRKSEESGEVMVEAIYVVVIAIMVIFFAINVGVVYHNRIVVTAVANEAASGVAGVYARMDQEPFYAYMEKEDFKHIYPYRYRKYGDLTDSTAVGKAKWYASYLVYESEFSTNKELDFSGISVECDDNGIGLKTLSVTVKRTYPVFIMNPVSFFGLNPEYDAEATGTAVCYDVIHQMNSIALADEIENKLGANIIGENIETILNIIDKIQEILNFKTNTET